jgi:hypothetical protein
MTALRTIVIAVVAFAAGCTSPAPRKPPVSASPKGERVFAYQSCIQLDRVPVCVNSPADAQGMKCGCVDRKRVSGEFNSLFGSSN